MDLQTADMSQLVSYYNEMAEKLGKPKQGSFKSVGAAQAMCLKLEALMPKETKVENAETQTISQADVGTVPVAVDPATGEAAAPVATPEGDKGPAAANPIDPAILAAMAAAAAMAKPGGTVAARGPNQGVGAYCKELIAAGKTNAEILAAVAVKFAGTAKTTASCIAFYRNALKGGAASRPRGGKVNIEALEQRQAKLAEQIQQAKIAAAAKEAAAKLAAQQAELLAKAQAEAAQKYLEAQAAAAAAAATAPPAGVAPAEGAAPTA